MRSKQLLRRTVASEWLVYGLVWFMVLTLDQASLAWWFPATAATWLAMRVVIIGSEFAIALHFAGSDQQRVGPLAMIRCIAIEIARIVPSFSLFQAFPDQLVPASLLEAEPRTDPAQPVVLLVPGFTCNPAMFRGLRRALEVDGFCVDVVELMPVFSPVADYVPIVAARIERLCERQQAAQVHLVGHSMGGLVLRATLAATGEARAASVVTIGSPHAGTALARLSTAPNALDMRIGSSFLSTLEQASLPLSRWLCIASDHDNLVAPSASALLPGAHHLRLFGVGHVSMVDDAPVQAAIGDWIRAHPAAIATDRRASQPTRVTE